MPPIESISVDLKQLQALYTEDTNARAILDHFANRERNQNTSTVHRLMANIASDGFSLSRGQIIHVLKELDGLGCGSFKAGRKGYESRFEWHVSSKSVGQVAAGESSEIEEDVPPSSESPDDISDESIEHKYQLRPGLSVSLALPSDFSMREAERLARFILTLPFDRGVEQSRSPVPPILSQEDFSDWMK